MEDKESDFNSPLNNTRFANIVSSPILYKNHSKGEIGLTGLKPKVKAQTYSLLKEDDPEALVEAIQVGWTRQELGWFKLNVDASIQKDHMHQHALVAIGGVVRDMHGRWHGGFAGTVPDSSILAAELKSILQGLHRKQAKLTWISPISGDVSVPENVHRHHAHAVAENQCCSAVVQAIDAPVDTVWSVVRRFDKPQAYKHFLKSCHVIDGDGDVGTLREVRVVSGLPAESSTERLEILDDERHVMSFSVVGGDHRLHNYRSVTTLHAAAGGGSDRTVVVESYVVDIPQGNTVDETCAFVDTIVKCNLQSLAQIADNLTKNIVSKSS
ncbi:hypothetical protein BUALT_Bualt01G0053000 [Buddleja alternifolia]|uniref:Uncharacterized protein n=1 Tax=Buddleja alternifolia TaxID=168488 RepID=A0AAV6Y5P8_9LAMI|nr:hypothetical protein BUALT_Bualt01G0053000 [Buddleja alternifolia]